MGILRNSITQTHQYQCVATYPPHLKLGKQVSAIASPDGFQEPPEDIFTFENTNLIPFSIATNSQKPIEISIRPWSEGAQYYENPGEKSHIQDCSARK